MSDSEVVRQNRVYWEHLAPHRPGEPVEFFRTGGSALTDTELALVGDLTGRRVLHLACSVGDEAISFAQLGAEVTGVDIAPSHLATARAKAAAVGVSVTFIEADMTNLAPSLTGYDLIYISWGGICWVPDLRSWTRSLASRLTLGGTLLISEHHPLWEVLTVRGNNTLAVTADYFNAARDGYTDPSKAPQITRTLGTPALPHRSYVHSLGAVVTAVLDAGLTLSALQEHPYPDSYPGLGESADHIPATYLLTAKRPE
jgi:2-polyprenyl-3-methyl-5-hydroxy-6-metoxy-1,4-benzoquinol methylase